MITLVLRDEQYIEMLVGLSRKKEAYLEIFHYLEQCYPGFNADFVFNPGNYLLKELLDLRNAEYEPEQQKMVLGTPVLGIDTTGVELLSEQYTEQYCAIHAIHFKRELPNSSIFATQAAKAAATITTMTF